MYVEGGRILFWCNFSAEEEFCVGVPVVACDFCVEENLVGDGRLMLNYRLYITQVGGE